MTHVQINHMPDGSIDEFHRVDALVPDTRPDGLVARYVGAGETGFTIVSVWSSKEHADRFGDVLRPILERELGPDDGSGTHLGFEAVDVLLVGA